MKQFSASLAFIFFCFIAAAQNVGIGTVSPTKPLTLRQDGIGIRQEESGGIYGIGFYTSGNSTYLQTHNASDLKFATNDSTATMVLQRGTGNLGIGTIFPTARLHVNGNMKITDGSQGDGKVLTSDAAGNAAWKTQAYGNTEPFFFKCAKSGSAISYTLSTKYNLGTATAALSGNQMNVSFNKTGLYHIDINATATLGDPTLNSIAFGVYQDGNKVFEMLNVGTSTGSSAKVTVDKSFEIYITAGEVYGFYFPGYVSPAISSQNQFTVNGHLIAD